MESLSQRPPVAVREVTFTAQTINQCSVPLTATLLLDNKSGVDCATKLACRVFEIGCLGEKPDWPIAVSEPVKIFLPARKTTPVEVSLAIGTPFFWADNAPQCYALETLIDSGSEPGCYQTRFRLPAPGGSGATQALHESTDIPSPLPASDSKLPALFVVGDSTARCHGENQLGWGDLLVDVVGRAKTKVLNRAHPGRSSRSYRNEGLWRRVLAELKPADVVLIQFGHNDADKLDEGRCRGALPGIGADTVEVVMAGGKREIVHTYGWYLRQYIAEAKARRATPVLLSLTVKNIWTSGRVERNQSDYGRWSEQVARHAGVAFLDAAKLIADHYDALGQERVQPLFCSVTDNVHTSPGGAALNAAAIAAGIRALGSLRMG